MVSPLNFGSSGLPKQTEGEEYFLEIADEREMTVGHKSTF